MSLKVGARTPGITASRTERSRVIHPVLFAVYLYRHTTLLLGDPIGRWRQIRCPF